MLSGQWQEFDEAHVVGDERAPKGRKRVAQGDGVAGALGYPIKSPRAHGVGDRFSKFLFPV